MSSLPKWLVDLIVVILRWIVEHLQDIGVWLLEQLKFGEAEAC